MIQSHSIYYASPVGMLRITERGNRLVAIEFMATCSASSQSEIEAVPLLKETVRQLTEYFDGKRRDFDLPLDLQGADFWKRVWQALRAIPYGETRSYKQMAEAVGCPKGSRAVGMANNRNPIPIIIPCHRVIGADGKLVGYAGGLEMKKQLLAIEKVF